MNIIKVLLNSAAFLALVSCGANKVQEYVDPLSVNGILDTTQSCSADIVVRYQSLEGSQLDNLCEKLSATEQRFHQLFGSSDKPVQNDNNGVFRLNMYRSSHEFSRYAQQHYNLLNMATLPFKTRSIIEPQVDFVSFNQPMQTVISQRALIEYLDGRFNIFGEFCQGLHDDKKSECTGTTPRFPHLVWWMEGLPEYMMHGDYNPTAVNALKRQRYLLSDLFNTSYHRNGGKSRIKSFSYLATRYMLENHRRRVDNMLELTRTGDFSGYQALIKSWGRTMDQDFDSWCKNL